MHSDVLKFVSQVKSKHPFYFFRSRVLEVGSANINGSVRKKFNFCRYKGIDLAEGRGVDLVHDITQPLYFGWFDVVISVEMLEHCNNVDVALKNMYDAVKPKGLLIITAAGIARHEHGTSRTDEGSSPETIDHYKNISMEQFQKSLPPNLFYSYNLEYRRDFKDIMFYGIKT
jgi:SAM-dependent methyltransferase